MKSLENTLLLLIAKIEAFTQTNASPSNNINIYQHGASKAVASSSSSSQTDPSKTDCLPCGKPQIQVPDNNLHKEFSHSDMDAEACVVPSLTCNVCNESFTSENSLKEHITKAHASSSFSTLPKECSDRPCAYCNKRFKTIIALTKHIELYHRVEDSETIPCPTNIAKPLPASSFQKSGTLQCKSCKILFSSDNELMGHSCSVHVVAWSCDKCTSSFTTKTDMQEHKETEHAITFLTCNYCAYKCESRTHLRKHVAALHQGDTADPDLFSTDLSSTSSGNL